MALWKTLTEYHLNKVRKGGQGKSLFLRFATSIGLSSFYKTVWIKFTKNERTNPSTLEEILNGRPGLMRSDSSNNRIPYYNKNTLIAY